MTLTRTIVIYTVLIVLSLAGMRVMASPRPRTVRADPALRSAIKSAARRAVRSGRAAGLSPLQIRGKVQASMLRQVKAHRSSREYKAMQAAGLKVSKKQVNGFVNREFDAFLSNMKRPARWEQRSGGQKFGIFYKALLKGFVTRQTFPANWKNLDTAARGEVVRCLAGNCSPAKAQRSWAPTEKRYPSAYSRR